jgi:hypothetical protein
MERLRSLRTPTDRGPAFLVTGNESPERVEAQADAPSGFLAFGRPGEFSFGNGPIASPGDLSGCGTWRPETRKPRGSLGRNLNPLGTLVHSVSGRGPNSDWRLAIGRSRWRGAIRRSLTVRRPPLLVSEKSLRVVRPAARTTARRSRRIPVRSSDRPRCPQFPNGSEYPAPRFRRGFRRSAPSARVRRRVSPVA